MVRKARFVMAVWACSRVGILAVGIDPTGTDNHESDRERIGGALYFGGDDGEEMMSGRALSVMPRELNCTAPMAYADPGATSFP